MSERMTPDDGSPRRSRWILGGLAALIPIVPIVIALVLSSSGAPHRATATATRAAATSHFTPLHAPRRSRSTTTGLPAGQGALVGFVVRPTAIAAAPGGRRLATLPTHTSFGSPESVWVRRVSGDWLGVVSVAAGNNRLGWIRRGADVQLTRENWTVRVRLAQHELFVYRGANLTRHYVIAIGKPSAPTPPGAFAVTDRLTTGEADGPYGCCILALSATAPHAISDWDGGNRIAIHSYPITSTIGQSVSHGCMHVTDAEGQWLIDHVPLGTPVIISSA